MGKIKNWISDIKYWLSELSGVWILLIFVVATSVISWGTSEFLGRKYEKFYENNHSCTWSVTQFKNICGKTLSNDDGGGIEYYKFYDSRGQAINDFMTLARMYDGKYANGKFRHLYVPRRERIYQCWDKDKRLIAVRFVKHKAGIWYGDWEEWKPSYEVDLYIEKEKRED